MSTYVYFTDAPDETQTITAASNAEAAQAAADAIARERFSGDGGGTFTFWVGILREITVTVEATVQRDVTVEP